MTNIEGQIVFVDFTSTNIDLTVSPLEPQGLFREKKESLRNLKFLNIWSNFERRWSNYRKSRGSDSTTIILRTSSGNTDVSVIPFQCVMVN